MWQFVLKLSEFSLEIAEMNRLTLNWTWKISSFLRFSRFWLIWIVLVYVNFETEFVQLFKFSLYCNKKALCLFLLIILKVKAVYSCRLFTLTRAIWTDWTIQFEPSMRTRLSRAWLFQLGNWVTIYLNCQVYFNRKIILSCGD